MAGDASCAVGTVRPRSAIVNVFGYRPMPKLSACTTGRCSKTSGEGTRGEQGTDALSAYGDFSNSDAKRAASLGCKRALVRAGRCALEAWPVSDVGEARAIALKDRPDFVLSSKSRRCQTFERRHKRGIDTLQTVPAPIMTYRTLLEGMAFCAVGRRLRNAR